DAMCIIESMPVKSLITTPQSGTLATRGEAIRVGGFAWAGDLAVASVSLSIDFGATWQTVQLSAPVNRFAWQRFEHALVFPESGYFEIWAKAVDTEGSAQPMVVPGWNPKGYLNNACHRISVQVVA
ncbi:MAG: molybdopterin containing oxidoreductase, partial [Pseudomonadales bacterium]